MQIILLLAATMIFFVAIRTNAVVVFVDVSLSSKCIKNWQKTREGKGGGYQYLANIILMRYCICQSYLKTTLIERYTMSLVTCFSSDIQ